jgi:hypothetical protein
MVSSDVDYPHECNQTQPQCHRATTQTRRRPQTQITSTPSPKNNHNPHKTSTAIIGKKGRSGPALHDADDTQQPPHNDYTLSPPRSPMPSSPPDHWGPEDESSDIPDDHPNLHMVSPMRNDPHERLEQATQGPEQPPPPMPSTQGARQRPSPKQPSTKRGAQSPHKSPIPQTTMKQAHRGTPEHHKKQKEGTKTPPAAQAQPTETFAHINTHRVPPPPSPQRLQQPPHPSHPTPRYPTHPPSQETAYSLFHTESPQYPIGDPLPQTTQPETTTMEAHQPTPRDTDNHMTQENPAADRGRRFDPHPEPLIAKPPNWEVMTSTQRIN